MPACAAPISAPDDRCRPLAESARAGSSTNPIPAASDTAANKSSGTPRAAIEPRTRACRPGGMRGRASGWSFLARLCRAHSLSSAAGSRPRGRCGYCNRGIAVTPPRPGSRSHSAKCALRCLRRSSKHRSLLSPAVGAMGPSRVRRSVCPVAAANVAVVAFASVAPFLGRRYRRSQAQSSSVTSVLGCEQHTRTRPSGGGSSGFGL